jgi:GMP synthase-like glutamine amidotransferase
MIKRALVFQHMDDEPPGLFGGFLRDAGAQIDVVMLHRGENVPTLHPYDFLLVMGGAMDEWEEDTNPWLRAEKQAIAEWTGLDRPFFGVCLGMQLLAEALGGKVGLASVAEVGIGSLTRTDEHIFTQGLPKTFRMMQWHHAEVTELPAGAISLAISDTTAVQIMAVGDMMGGTQFHGELTPALIKRWAQIPQYIEWLEQALGPGAYDRVRAEALPLMPAMRRVSQTMFENLVAGKKLRAAA